MDLKEKKRESKDEKETTGTKWKNEQNKLHNNGKSAVCTATHKSPRQTTVQVTFNKVNQMKET
jgi:hypothetical protein